MFGHEVSANGNHLLMGIFGDGYKTVVLKNSNLTGGYLLAFNAYVTKGVPVAFQIWRPNGTNFALVDEMTYTPQITGVVTAYADKEMPVESGDMLGFTSLGTQSTIASYGLPGQETSPVLTFAFTNTTDRTAVGQTELRLKGKNNAFKYSLSATMSSMFIEVSANGNPLSQEVFEDGYKTVILKNSNLTGGYLLAFNAYVTKGVPVAFQIWRPNGTHFTLVNEMTYKPQITGVVTVYADKEMPVESGDMLGFTSLGTQSPIASYGLPGQETSPVLTFTFPNPADRTVVGQTELRFKEKNNAFKYSLSITQSPIFTSASATGNQLLQGVFGDGYTTVILKNSNLTGGYLLAFNAYVMKGVPVAFQIWRPNGTNFTLVNEMLYTPQITGVVNVYTDKEMPVESGDMLGFTSLGTQSPIAGYGLPGQETSPVLTFAFTNATDRIAVGQTGMKFKEKNNAFKYSLSITMSPIFTTVSGGGNQLLQGVFGDGYKTVVLKNSNLTGGYLLAFNAYVTKGVPVAFQIWRPNGTNLTLLNEMTYTPQITGVVTVYADKVMPVENGDMLGFTSLGTQSPIASYGLPGQETSPVLTFTFANPTDRTSIGQTEMKFKEKNNAFKYSLLVTLSSILVAAPGGSNVTLPEVPVVEGTVLVSSAGNPSISLNDPAAKQGETGFFVDIFDSIDLPAGYLYRFTTTVKTSDEVRLQIYRPDLVDKNKYELIFDQPFRAPFPGTFVVYGDSKYGIKPRRQRRSIDTYVKAGTTLNFPIKAGDKLAFSSGTASNPVVYVPGYDSDSGSKMKTLDTKTGGPQLGSSVEVVNRLDGYRFAVRVDISDVPLTEPNTTISTHGHTSGPVSSGGYETAAPGKRIYIYEDSDLPDGYVYRFNCFMNLNETVKFQIYRLESTNPNQYKLVAEQPFTPNSREQPPDSYTVYPAEGAAIAVKKGDKFGFMITDRNPIFAKLQTVSQITTVDVIGADPVVGGSVFPTGKLVKDADFQANVEIGSRYLKRPTLSTVRVGNPDTSSRLTNEAPSIIQSYIVRGKPIPNDGFVQRFNAYLANNESVNLQIWRPVNVGQGEYFALVGEVPFSAPSGPREYRVYPPNKITVKTGDYIGFTTIGDNPITFKYLNIPPPPNSDVIEIRNLKNEEVPTEGQVLQETGISYTKLYPINADISSEYVLPPIGGPGATGATGDAGAQGLPGASGVQGGIGPDGPGGSTGAQGASGVKGEQGDAGIKGPKGQTGDQGAIGPPGIDGQQGNQGPVGKKGVTGSRGIPGPPGNAGPMGITGIKGVTGNRGTQGKRGDKGPPGDDGFTGATGPFGQQGPPGAFKVTKCGNNNGGCDHLCIDQFPWFQCKCNPGYKLQEDGKTCLDVNECNMYNGGCTRTCGHSEGRPICSCGKGFTLSDNNKTCTDIDECESPSRCKASEICMNFEGTSTCYAPSEDENNKPSTGAQSDYKSTFINRNMFIALIVWAILLSLGCFILLLVILCSNTQHRRRIEPDMISVAPSTRRISQATPSAGGREEFALPEFTEIYDNAGADI
ncbi:uncharacterized protein LOC141906210 [Tubulanus polymorphus]|uniref:uncharacterized protein LOC141906210 n=1 Tax=Tubulanus polymorphus TaxID=672921 RepID=UPI003DA339D8